VGRSSRVNGGEAYNWYRMEEEEKEAYLMLWLMRLHQQV